MMSRIEALVPMVSGIEALVSRRELGLLQVCQYRAGAPALVMVVGAHLAPQARAASRLPAAALLSDAGACLWLARAPALVIVVGAHLARQARAARRVHTAALLSDAGAHGLFRF